MEIINQTPFEAVWLFGNGPQKKEIVTVIVKGTFDLVHKQKCSVATRQLPIFESDQFYHKSAKSSIKGKSAKSIVKVEGDYVLFKPKTDVVLLGKAHPHGGSPPKYIDVSLDITGMAGFPRAIRVYGNREWEGDLQTRLEPSEAPEIIDPIDLTFDKAFGGEDEDQKTKKPSLYYEKNPVGEGYYATRAHAFGKSLPNLEDPGNLLQDYWNEVGEISQNLPDPRCFGWFGRAWEPRLSYAVDRGKSSPELRENFMWQFNNGASPDLILPYLNGDEEIVLTNCEPAGLFKFRLPGIAPKVAVDFGFGAEPVNMVLDTLCIMMETSLEVGDQEVSVEKQAYVVWRGKITIDETHRLEAMKKIIIN